MQITFKIIKCILHEIIANYCSTRKAPNDNRLKIIPIKKKNKKKTKNKKKQKQTNTSPPKKTQNQTKQTYKQANTQTINKTATHI